MKFKALRLFIAVVICAVVAYFGFRHLSKAEPTISRPALALLPPFRIPLQTCKLFIPARSTEQIDLTRKKITERLTGRDIEHVQSTDPQLFAKGRQELIYLSLLHEGDYAFPLPKANVISVYGSTRHHSGVDLKTFANDTIVSAFEGIVRLARPYEAYGNVIVVRHYNGLETVYSHNSKNLVSPGDHVKAGQPIALTGRTGRATTEHLHFEARIDGEHFDPNLLFDFKTRTLQPKILACKKQANTIKIRATNLLPHQLLGAYSLPDPSLNQTNQTRVN